MKKRETLIYIKLSKGYVPYSQIFDIFNDEDDIPQELIDLSLKEDKPKDFFMICSSELSQQLKNLNKNLYGK